MRQSLQSDFAARHPARGELKNVAPPANIPSQRCGHRWRRKDGRWMSVEAKLRLENNEEIDLPVVVGTEQERAVDISKLLSKTNHITLDEVYVNTGACTSNITFLDGD